MGFWKSLVYPVFHSSNIPLFRLILSPSSSRPRTPAFHAGNRGSNPLGDAKKLYKIRTYKLSERRSLWEVGCICCCGCFCSLYCFCLFQMQKHRKNRSWSAERHSISRFPQRTIGPSTMRMSIMESTIWSSHSFRLPLPPSERARWRAIRGIFTSMSASTPGSWASAEMMWQR